MNIRTRSSLPNKTGETNVTVIDDGSLNSNDEERGFQFFFQEQIKKEDIENSSENELKMRERWNNLRNSRKKIFMKIVFETSHKLKRFHSQQSASEHSTSVTSNKKLKLEFNENLIKNDLNVNHVEQFFQLEIQRLIASPAQYNFQPVCHVCEEFVDMVNIKRCSGVCLRYYHRSCLEYPSEHPLPEDGVFQCPDCLTNTYSCILCKKSDKITSLLHCENSDCGRLYHRRCLDKSNMICLDISHDSVKSCPAHFCVSCSKENPSYVEKHNKKLFQCIRCPMAFHDAELCMAAGAVELSLSHVICPRHFETNLIKMTSYKPVHTEWCFKCFKTGVKLLCHYCPASFHNECVNNAKKYSEKKDSVFVCSDCSNHRQPRYGEILFVKAGFYRWWPSEVVHPRNAPMNILKLKRPEGTFPILFLGSREYQWMSKSRVIHYNIGEHSPIIADPGGTGKVEKQFSAGIKDAARMYPIFVNILMRRVPLKSITAPAIPRRELAQYLDFKESENRTVKYKLIKTNVVVLPAKLPIKKTQSVCDCINVCMLNKCKNSLNRVECDPDSCPTKDLCQNQLFTKHTNKNLGVNKTSNRGFGLKTIQLLEENEFIIEYVGEIITKAESVLRFEEAKKNSIKDFYMIKFQGDLVIDAGPSGNLSRFINHACDPNCRLEKWIVNGYPRLGIFAKRNIEPGGELTFDYRLSGVLMKEDIFCLCNSTNCSGFLGQEKIKSVGPMKVVTNTAAQEQDSSYSPKVVSGEDNDSELDEAVKTLDDSQFSSQFMKVPILSISPLLKSSDNFDIMQGISSSNGFIENNKSCDESLVKLDSPSTKIVPTNKNLHNFIAPKEPVTIRDPIITIDLCNDLNNEESPDRMPYKIPLENRESPLRLALAKISEEATCQARHNIGKQEITKETEHDDVQKVMSNVDSIKKCLKRRIKRHVNDVSSKVFLLKDSITDTDDKKESMEVLESKNITLDTDVNIVKKNSVVTIDLTDESLDNGKVLKEPVKRRRIKRSKEPEITIIPFNDIVKAKDPVGRSVVESTVSNICKGVDSSTLPTKTFTSAKNYIDKNNLSKESPSKIDFIVTNHQSINMSEDLSKKVDPIKEYLRATDAAVESNSKIIVIKEVVPSSDLNKDRPQKTGKLKVNTKKKMGMVNRISPTNHCVVSGKQEDKSKSNAFNHSEIHISEEVSVKKDTIYESFCFRCFDGGELVLCDKQGCTKTYHLSCIGLKMAPSGTWYCPWHFCNVCGDPSTLFCAQCPGSYCGLHSIEDNIVAGTGGSRLSLCHFHKGWKERLAAVSK